MKIDPCSIKGEPGQAILSPEEFEIIDQYKLNEEDWGEDEKTYTGRFKTYYNEETGLYLPNSVMCKAIYLSGELLAYESSIPYVGCLKVFDDGFFEIGARMPYPTDEIVLLAYLCEKYEKEPNEKLKEEILAIGTGLVKYHINMPILLIRLNCILNNHFKVKNNLLINVDELNDEVYLAQKMVENVTEEDLDEFDF